MVDTLRETLEYANEFSAVTSEFSIFAFDGLRRSLQSVGPTKLLLTSNSQPAEYSEDTLSLLGKAAERALRNNLNAAAAANACAECVENTVEVRRASAPVPFTLYTAGNNGKAACGIQGASTFSASGLGIMPSPRSEMNNLLTDGEQVESLRSYFGLLWSDPRLAQPAKKFFVVETKSEVLFDEALRPTEVAKNKCGKAHFGALGTGVVFEKASSNGAFEGSFG